MLLLVLAEDQGGLTEVVGLVWRVKESCCRPGSHCERGRGGTPLLEWSLQQWAGKSDVGKGVVCDCAVDYFKPSLDACRLNTTPNKGGCITMGELHVE